jgi:Type I phosphodiesterase / nucleotide pyrophosphatase
VTSIGNRLVTPGPATAMTSALPEPPPYGARTLAELMPAVATALGAPVADDPGDLVLPEAPRGVVLLVDGLGDVLLRARSGHAPFLRSLFAKGQRLSSGFPSTTATSMGSFGTGLPPGGHGLVGYEVLDPDRDVLLNELSWEPHVDPHTWQPNPTVFERLDAASVPVTRIGPAFFDGSGLTESALRGGAFVSADALDARVDAALTALRATPRALVYVYWGDIDKVGHVHGCQSWEWGEELTRVDDAVRRLAEGLPSDAALHVTADHGMVDVAMDRRLDLAHEPELSHGVRHSGGEPRALHLYCEPGAADDVAAAWSERLDGQAWVLSRAQAVSAGWFGAVSAQVLPRIGDVVVATSGEIAVVDSRHQRPQLLALIGLHGSLSVEETAVPLLSVLGSKVG